MNIFAKSHKISKIDDDITTAQCDNIMKMYSVVWRKKEYIVLFGQIQTLTLRVPLVPSVLQWQADRAVVPRAVLPMGDDLPRWCTVSNWGWKGAERQKELGNTEVYEGGERDIRTRMKQSEVMGKKRLSEIRDVCLLPKKLLNQQDRKL